MERWKRLNVFVSLAGLVFSIISLLFVKFNPLLWCLVAFGLGIAWKGFKNIYKNVDPPSAEKVTNPYDRNMVRTKKKKKKKKR